MAEEKKEKRESRLAKVFGEAVKPGKTPAAATPRVTAPVSRVERVEPRQALSPAPATSRAPTAAPAAPPKELTISIPIVIRFDERFKAKLPFLALALALLVFSFVLFEKSNFHLVDMVDIARIQFNLPKLWSASFILFILLYSFSLALAMAYGFKQNFFTALLVLPFSLVLALAVSLFYSPGLLLPFIALALTVSASSAIAALRAQVKFSTIYSTAGTALLIFVLLAFLVSFSRIASNKDYYFATFISSGFTASISQLQGGSPLAFDAATIKKFVTRSQVEEFFSRERIEAALAQVSGWGALSEAAKNESIAKARKKLVDDFYASIGEDVSELLKNVRASAAAPIGQPGQTPQQIIASVRETLGQSPAFVAFYNYFALLLATLVTAIAALFAFVVKVISTLFCWLLAKL